MVKQIVDGDYLFAEDLNSIISALHQNGVISGFDVSTSSGMTISITKGKAYVNNKKVVKNDAQTATIDTADSSLNRIDLVTLDENGDVNIITGSPLTNPIPPIHSLKRIVLASVLVEASTTVISSGDITDERILVKNQMYKLPWLSEVETGGDVYVFDNNNTTIETNWTRVTDTDYSFNEDDNELVMQNGLIRIQTRLQEGSNYGDLEFMVIEDRDYDGDNTCEYVSVGQLRPYFYTSSQLATNNIYPNIIFNKLSSGECQILYRYVSGDKTYDFIITMKKGERFVNCTGYITATDANVTRFGASIEGIASEIDSRFCYVNSTSTTNFADGLQESANITYTTTDLTYNYDVIYGKTSTEPVGLGLAILEEGSLLRNYYSSDEWNVLLWYKSGLTLGSDTDTDIDIYPFAFPFVDIDHLFKEAEVSTGVDFGRTDTTGTWVSVASGSRSGGNYLTNDDANGGSSAQNDEVTYDFYVPKTGYYDIWAYGYEGTTFGIADVELDTVSQGSMDWYAGSGAWDYRVVENVSISQGRHDISFYMSSKNASSTDYELTIDCIYLVPKYETTGFDGDFPYDIARQAISDNTFSYGYTDPLNYEGILDTNDITNDWTFSAVDVAQLPVGTTTCSETIDFYRYALKRKNTSVISQEAETSKTDVTGTWSTESGYGDDSTDSISCTTDGGEVKWTITFPEDGWYLARVHVRESDDGTDDKYQYSIKNNSTADPYVSMSNNHLHDEDSSDATIDWSYAEALIYAKNGDQDIQIMGENVGTDKKVIDILYFYPIDPIPFVGSPSTPTEITLSTRLVSDVPHSRFNGINQMDSIQADYGRFKHLDMEGDVDMNMNEIKQLVIHVSDTAPSNPVEGQLWYDNTNSKFKGWNGSTWSELG